MACLRTARIPAGRPTGLHSTGKAVKQDQNRGNGNRNRNGNGNGNRNGNRNGNGGAVEAEAEALIATDIGRGGAQSRLSPRLP
jgi:hypothetical protein